MARDNKREKFTQPQKKNPMIWVGVVGLVFIAAIGWFVYSNSAGSGGTSVTGKEINYFKAEPVSYNPQVNMVDVEPVVENGKLVLSLAKIKEGGIVWTKYSGKKDVPVTAFFTPSGKLLVAVAMCEPCNGERFWIDGSYNNLVCSSCGTRWNLEDLKGISGGCPEYPPDQLNYQVEGDKILIDTAEIESWKNRITGL